MKIIEIFIQIWATIFASRGTAISVIGTISSRTSHMRVAPLTISAIKPPKAIKIANSEEQDESANVSNIKKIKSTVTDTTNTVSAYGLTLMLSAWVRQQRLYDNCLKNLAEPQTEFLAKDIKNIGCVMPPSLETLPDISKFSFPKDFEMEKKHEAQISACLNILQCSHFPWAYQFTSPTKQHTTGIAANLMALTQNIKIFQQYLGDDIIWETYEKTLAMILTICPTFVPWHSVTNITRIKNAQQIVNTISIDTEEDIGATFGAGMARSAAQITNKYQIGINKVINAVEAMATYEHGGQTFISQGVQKSVKALLQVSTYILCGNFTITILY